MTRQTVYAENVRGVKTYIAVDVIAEKGNKKLIKIADIIKEIEFVEDKKYYKVNELGGNIPKYWEELIKL